MTTITNITVSRSEPVKLVQDELWQARGGTVYVSTTLDPGPKEGIAVKAGFVLSVSAGTTVRYRKNGKAKQYLVREAI